MRRCNVKSCCSSDERSDVGVAVTFWAINLKQWGAVADTFNGWALHGNSCTLPRRRDARPGYTLRAVQFFGAENYPNIFEEIIYTNHNLS